MDQKQPPNVFKYVLFLFNRDERTTDQRIHIPVLFPRHVMHSDMDEAMAGYAVHNGYMENRYHQTIAAVSAGFIDLNTLQCFGESESLDLKSRPEDSQIIREYFKDDGKLPAVPAE